MNPDALKRARELRGLTATALAAKLDVSQSILSQIESGRVKASPEMTRRIAKALNVPNEFLLRPPWPVGDGSLGLFFRAHSSKVNKGEVLSIRRSASVLVELTERLSEGLIRPKCTIDKTFGENIAHASNAIRATLGYASDEPLGNLTRRLEKQGVTIVKSDLKRDAVFGYSFWLHGKNARPFIILSHYQTPYRLRWTLAHELGHIVLGHEFSAIEAKEADKQADIFAGALLVPPDMLLDDLEGGVTLSSLSHLKRKYGVSVAALIRRTHDSGLIDHQRYESLFVQISQKGWRKAEPGDDKAEYEEPVLLSQMIQEKYGRGADAESIAADMGLPEDVVFAAISKTRTYLEDARLRGWMAGQTISIENDENT